MNNSIDFEKLVTSVIKQKMQEQCIYDVNDEVLKEQIIVYTQTICVFQNYLQRNFISVLDLKRRDIIDFVLEYANKISITDIVIALLAEFEIYRQLEFIDDLKCFSFQETVNLICEILYIYLEEDEEKVGVC